MVSAGSSMMCSTYKQGKMGFLIDREGARCAGPASVLGDGHCGIVRGTTWSTIACRLRSAVPMMSGYRWSVEEGTMDYRWHACRVMTPSSSARRSIPDHDRPALCPSVSQGRGNEKAWLSRVSVPDQRNQISLSFESKWRWRPAGNQDKGGPQKRRGPAG